jgi:hypothetical protein
LSDYEAKFSILTANVHIEAIVASVQDATVGIEKSSLEAQARLRERAKIIEKANDKAARGVLPEKGPSPSTATKFPAGF